MSANVISALRAAARRLGRLGEEVRPLSVGGLALLLVLGAVRWLGPADQRTKSALYLAMGTVFPALLVASSVLPRLGAAGEAAGGLLALGFAALGAWGVLSFVAGHFDGTLLALALAGAAGLAVVRGVRIRREGGAIAWEFRYGPRGQAEVWGRLPGEFVVLLALLASWFFAVRLVFWTDFEAWVTFSLYRALVLIAALALVTWNLGARGGARPGRRPRWWLVADAAALALIALASTRVDTLGAPSRTIPTDVGNARFFHWGAVVGSAELVRQGGWLLWDVPSSYGFLSTLAIAGLPFRSVWQSYYTLHVAMTAATASMLYFALRSLRSGPSGYAFALVLTLAAAFLVPGMPYHEGTSMHPPLGAFRYFWCYALLGVLLWEYRASPRAGRGWAPALVGNAAWLLGTLWSPESAVYCSAIWLPAFGVMAWRRALSAHPGPGMGRWARRLGATGLWLSLPVLGLASAVGAISAYYRARLGRYPDWARLFDYILSFTGGVMADPPHRPDGAVWCLVLLLCALSAFAVATLGRRASCATMAVAAGVWGMFWATSGYFVMRGDVYFLICLGPIHCLGMALALGLIDRERLGRRLSTTVRAAFIPVVTVMLTLGYGDVWRLKSWTHTLRRGYVASVERLMPQMDPALARLLDRAGVGPDEPITFVNRSDAAFQQVPLPIRPAPGSPATDWRNRAWLPTTPFVLFETLPSDRPGIYMERFAERARLGGWLIESKVTSADKIYPWFFDALTRTHAPVDSFEDAHWRLTRYELRDVATARRITDDKIRR